MKQLAQYVEQKNFWAKITNGQLMDASALTKAQIKDLLDSVECDLSPENLCCDGELRGAALKQKSKMLNEVQHELEVLAYAAGIDYARY